MGDNMKTTIDISDSLLQEAKKLAVEQNVTLRSIFEQGLREILSKEKTSHVFKLRKASFKGKGMQEEFLGRDWRKIRDSIYEGHGG